MSIDPRAVVDPGARVADDVSIGPFTIVEDDVSIGPGCTIGPFVTIRSGTRIGENNRIFQYSSIGEAPQYANYAGEQTVLEIGHNNVFREFCTVNRGTPGHGEITRVGNDNFFMAYTHIAHDCVVGNQVIFANCASLAGHVEIGDHAILGGFTLVHQFCRVGAHSITGIGSVCLQDIPPFVVAAGNTARPHGINVKGLRRRGFEDHQIAELRRAYRVLYRSQLDLRTAIDRIESDHGADRYVEQLVVFLRSSDRGIIR